MSWSGAWTSEDAERLFCQRTEWPEGPYSHGTLLGQGGYASVYKVLRREDGGVFAGKTSPKAYKHLRREASILRRLSHEHIVKYVDYFEEEGYPAANVLVLELCAEGNLQTLINNHSDGVGRNETLQVMLQVSQALDYLHGGIARFHGDLKPRNILIRSWNPVNVVLGDCAEVMYVHNINVHGKPHGTRAYWSPFIYRHGKHAGTSDDIWALGISLLGMLSQWPTFVRQEERMFPKRCFTHTESLVKLNPGHDIVQLLGRMLEWDHKHRISSHELVRLVTQLIGDKDKEEAQTKLKVPEAFQPFQFW